MGETTSGIHSILSYPVVYSTFQRALGAGKVRSDFTKSFIRPFTGCTILDIGCGPADIFEYLGNADYWGFDVSHAYIQRAKKRYGSNGRFYCQELAVSDIIDMPLFDIVLALGLLHHLDDAGADDVIQLSYKALKPGGRFVTLDPCLEPRQNPIARFLAKSDRGKNVRNQAEYWSLASAVFKSPRVEIYHKCGIPYTHCFMECIRF